MHPFTRTPAALTLLGGVLAVSACGSGGPRTGALDTVSDKARPHCRSHQAVLPDGDYTAGKDGRTFAVLDMLKYYTAKGALPFCDAKRRGAWRTSCPPPPPSRCRASSTTSPRPSPRTPRATTWRCWPSASRRPVGPWSRRSAGRATAPGRGAAERRDVERSGVREPAAAQVLLARLRRLVVVPLK